jgi:hypothetical protein
MESKETHMKSREQKEQGSGLVHVAVLEEIRDDLDAANIVINSASNIFFDFSGALQLMSTPIWNSSIKTSTDSGFFVLSSPKK